MKKICVAVLSAALAFSVSVPAFAAEVDRHGITKEQEARWRTMVETTFTDEMKAEWNANSPEEQFQRMAEWQAEETMPHSEYAMPRDINGQRYFLYADGTPLAENAWIGGGEGEGEGEHGWSYLAAGGRLCRNEWVYDNGKWYYPNADGTVLSNFWHGRWVQSGGYWYFMNEVGDGSMLTDSWVGRDLTKEYTWYYVNHDGTMATGWKNINGKWYYFDTDGRIWHGWYQAPDGIWYYLDPTMEDSTMQTGWLKTDEGWYYLDDNGAMQIGWQEVNGKWYYMDASGLMAENTVISQNGQNYRVDKNGAWIK